MHASVPQFIDVEDKIAFGLTGRQLLWMGAMTAALILAYSLLDRQAFFIVGIVIVAAFGALAFWRPQGISLISFLGFVALFFTKPRSYVWKRVFSRRGPDIKKAHEIQRKEMDAPRREKKLPPQSQLRKIAWTLDTKK